MDHMVEVLQVVTGAMVVANTVGQKWDAQATGHVLTVELTISRRGTSASGARLPVLTVVTVAAAAATVVAAGVPFMVSLQAAQVIGCARPAKSTISRLATCVFVAKNRSPDCQYAPLLRSQQSQPNC